MSGQQVIAVRFDEVAPFYEQPRQEWDQERLEELAANLREHGQLEPCLVQRMTGKGPKYRLISGERRWRAGQIAKLPHLLVIETDVKGGDDDDAFIKAIVANSAREELAPVDVARAVDRVAKMPGFADLPTNSARLTKIARVFGHSQAWVENMLKLAGLAPEAQELVEKGDLQLQTAYELSAIKEPSRQAEVGKRIAEQGLKGPAAKKAAATAVAVDRVRNGDEKALSTGTPRGQRSDVETRLLNELVGRISENAESLLDMPAKRLAAALGNKPADRRRALARIDEAIAALNQLRKSLAKLGKESA